MSQARSIAGPLTRAHTRRTRRAAVSGVPRSARTVNVTLTSALLAAPSPSRQINRLRPRRQRRRRGEAVARYARLARRLCPAQMGAPDVPETDQ